MKMQNRIDVTFDHVAPARRHPTVAAFQLVVGTQRNDKLIPGEVDGRNRGIGIVSLVDDDGVGMQMFRTRCREPFPRR
jgi:hypothetical protein